jgi:cell division protein FtsB
MGSKVRDEKTTAGQGGTPAAPSRGRSIATYVLLFVALALVLDGIAGERGVFANRRDREQLDQAELALAAKRQENAELRELARLLRSQDPATIEDLARRELGYIRPGETVFIIRDVPKPDKK